MMPTMRNCYDSRERDRAVAHRIRRNKVLTFIAEFITLLAMFILIPIVMLSFV